MMTFILIIHSLVCVLLVLAILMQAGRGGGLTEQFQGAESVFGAQTNKFMVRTTSVLATVFFVTCLALAVLSARQERSLVADSAAKKVSNVGMNIPSVPEQVNAVKDIPEPINPSAVTVPAAETTAPVSAQ